MLLFIKIFCSEGIKENTALQENVTNVAYQLQKVYYILQFKNGRNIDFSASVKIFFNIEREQRI